MVAAKSSGLMLTSAQQKDSDFTIRLFNVSDEANQAVSLNFDFDRADLISLDGKEINQITDAFFTGKNKVLKLAIPQFGFRTIRFTKAVSN